MRSMTANDAKKHFGELLDTARREPVSIHKHGRPVTVMMSVEDFNDYQQAQRNRLKDELQIGLAQLDREEGAVVDATGLDDMMDTLKAEGRKRIEKSVEN